MRVALELRRNRRHHVEQLVALGAFGDTSPSGEMLVPDFEHDDRIGDDVVESLRVHGRATHRPNDDVSITGLHMHDRRHVAFSRLPSGAREKKLLQRALAERGNTAPVLSKFVDRIGIRLLRPLGERRPIERGSLSRIIDVTQEIIPSSFKDDNANVFGAHGVGKGTRLTHGRRGTSSSRARG